jgi:ribosome-binding factor A
MTRHGRQIEHLLRAELSELLQRRIKDPRLKGLVTVTEVSASSDLSQAKVFISILGTAEERREVFQGLNSASRFLRHELGRRLSLRYIPELSFEMDNSIERGVHLLKLIEQVSAEDGKLERS